MPEITIDLDPDLHARLAHWAQERRRPLSMLARDILAAAERVRANYDATMDETTRGIRRDRDGGCGLCDELDRLFASGRRRCQRIIGRAQERSVLRHLFEWRIALR